MSALKKPKGDSYYNNRAANYDKRRSRQEWWHVEQREMKSLLDGLPQDMNVVDIPFGTGRFVPYYDELSHTVFGLDASNEMLAAAKKSLGVLFDKCTCVTGTAAKLPFADGQFDLLVSTRFLRDIVVFADAQAMLAEFARVTSKYAIIQLGEHPDTHRRPDDNEVMGSVMSRTAVTRMLSGVGLKVIDRRLVKTNDDGGEIYHILCEKS